MEKLEELELLILEAVEKKRVTRIPSDAEDSGHTSWLLEKGFIEFGTDDRDLVLTEKGHAALAAAKSVRASGSLK